MASDVLLLTELPEAGTELDLRLAAEVLGFAVGHDGKGRAILMQGDRLPLPSYSCECEAAFLVVDYLFDLGYAVAIYASKHADPHMTWACHFAYHSTTHRAHAPTLPLAICRCALLAYEGESRRH